MKSILLFRKIALAEGLSLIILMGFAMPLKYLMGMPEAVRVVGWIHGILFLIYLWALLRVWAELDWGIGRVTIAFIASLVPFGTIAFDRSLKREQQALSPGSEN